MRNEDTFIMTKTRAISYPRFCPVCNEPVTTEGIIIGMSQQQRAEARRLHGGPFPSSRIVATMSPLVRVSSSRNFGSQAHIRIPTCDVHAFSFEDISRARGSLAVINGLLIIVTLLLSVIVLAGYFGSGTVNIGLAALTLLLGAGAILTYRLSGPTALERSISVYDMSPDFNTIVFKISNPEYADEILRLNHTTTERIEIG